MKKFTLLAALGALLVGIVGCAGEENTDNATDTNTTTPATTPETGG